MEWKKPQTKQYLGLNERFSLHQYSIGEQEKIYFLEIFTDLSER